MNTLPAEQQAALHGGWGFLCGAAIVMGVAGSIASGGSMIGPALIAAEWACAIDAVMDS
jgi:hypothetical protein